MTVVQIVRGGYFGWTYFMFLGLVGDPDYKDFYDVIYAAS